MPAGMEHLTPTGVQFRLRKRGRGGLLAAIYKRVRPYPPRSSQSFPLLLEGFYFMAISEDLSRPRLGQLKGPERDVLLGPAHALPAEPLGHRLGFPLCRTAWSDPTFLNQR